MTPTLWAVLIWAAIFVAAIWPIDRRYPPMRPKQQQRPYDWAEEEGEEHNGDSAS